MPLAKGLREYALIRWVRRDVARRGATRHHAATRFDDIRSIRTRPMAWGAESPSHPHRLPFSSWLRVSARSCSSRLVAARLGVWPPRCHGLAPSSYLARSAQTTHVPWLTPQRVRGPPFPPNQGVRATSALLQVRLSASPTSDAVPGASQLLHHLRDAQPQAACASCHVAHLVMPP
jgi:hypothetical protein